MQKMFRGSRDLAARHELDELSPTSAVTVKPATCGHLHDLVAIARREIPGVSVSEAGLAQFLRGDPESIFAFERAGGLLGGIAFLYLNDRGHDALLIDGIDLKNPGREFLARGHEDVSAIYVWALVCHGRAVVGLANVAGIFEKAAIYQCRLFRAASDNGRPRFADRNRLQADTELPARPLALRAAMESPSSEYAGITCFSREYRRCTALNPRPDSDSRAISIRIARDPNDLMLVTAIRAAVYLAEQDCPIEEEFDGNDLVAAHFIGFIGSEPAACLRVRFFGEFAKLERLAVRHQFRRSRISFKLVQASFEYLKRKGFKKVYGHAQDRLVNFWSHFGAKPLGHNRKITFSDFSYTEMVLDLEPDPDAITLDSDPYVIIRPEGDWDRPGILDISSRRAVTSPLRAPALAET